MYETGEAYEVDNELNTLGTYCPTNTLAPFIVNAHTRLDSKTGELYACTYDFKQPFLRYYVIDKNGALTKNFPIEKPFSTMIHDFVITENYVVFFDCPAIFDFANPGAFLHYAPELGTTIILVHRKTQQKITLKKLTP